VTPNKVLQAPPKKEKTELIFGKKMPITQGPNKKTAVTIKCCFLSKVSLLTGSEFPFKTLMTWVLPGLILIGIAMKRNRIIAILAITIGIELLFCTIKSAGFESL